MSMGHSWAEACIIKELDMGNDVGCEPTDRLSIRRSVRSRILERDGSKCGYCGATDQRLVLDHIWPVSKGGLTEEGNLITCCHPCNVNKGVLTLTQWQYSAPSEVSFDYAFEIFHGESL